MKSLQIRRCELCAADAAVHCPSDSAYLCRRCDSAVHAANFLVTHHIRSALCSKCGDYSGDRFSGPVAVGRNRHLCRSCSDDADDESSLSSIASSDTESSAAGRITPAKVSSRRRSAETKADVITEGILVNWCRKLGFGGAVDAVVENAGHVMGRLPGVRMRVALATSFWAGLRLCGEQEFATCRNLVRVERITGVPRKVILALEAKTTRVIKTRGRVATEDYEEGWAEC